MKLERIGKRVVVRPLKKSDYKAWKQAHLSQLPKAMNAWDSAAPADDRALQRKHFDQLLAKQKKQRQQDYFYEFGVFLKDGTLVGIASLMDISRLAFQNAYLGYRIFNNQWGKGYGKEAVQLVIDIAFRDLGLHRLEAGIQPKNRRSIALAKAVGLKREGFSPKRLFLRNQWLDMALYVARSEDFGITWKPKR